jgi:hypothetical protein
LVPLYNLKNDVWQSLTITLSYPDTTLHRINQGVISRKNYCVCKNGMSEESLLILQANRWGGEASKEGIKPA